MLKALSAVHGVDALTLEQRLLTDWAPTRDHYDALVDQRRVRAMGLDRTRFFGVPLPDDMASTISSMADCALNPNGMAFVPSWAIDLKGRLYGLVGTS